MAISIFTISILAMFAVLGQGLANTNYAKKKITASYLAQEGIEYLRNMRDSYALYDASGAQAGMNAFYAKLAAASCQTTAGCYFDPEKDQDGASFDLFSPASEPQPMTKILAASCPAGICPALLYDSASGKYGYGSGADSGFRRKITATASTSFGNVREVRITSNVSWKQGSGNYNITFSETLFSWIE